MDDRYVAELLQRFGDADEAARKQGTQFEQTHPTQQFREQPQENFGTGVSFLGQFTCILKTNDFLDDCSRKTTITSLWYTCFK